MLLVVMAHSDFLSLSNPTASDFAHQPANAFTRTFIESLSYVSVNAFILISGWFGIKFSSKGLLGFLFQCAYFLFGIYVLLLITGHADLTFQGIADCLLLTPDEWFVKAYLGLYIVSPILNIFADKTSKRTFGTVLLLFFAFETAYGWTNSMQWFKDGYNTFFFIGLYLLARYMRKYGLPIITRHGGAWFVLTAVLNTFLYYLLILNPRLSLVTVYSFINPFILVGSIGLFSWFNSLRMGHSKIINWVSASVFAVYLLHINTFLTVPFFIPTVQWIYHAFSGITCLLLIGLFDLLVFTSAIIADQPRKFLWKFFSGKLTEHLLR